MTALQKINYVGLSIPVFILLLGLIIGEVLLIIALWSTMLTGFIQVMIGLKLLDDYYKNFALQLYFILVILFFMLWYTTSWDWIWIMPPLLAIYMTGFLHAINLKTIHHENT